MTYRRARRALLENLRDYPVGTVVHTLDNGLGWRKTGSAKTDWECVVPHPSSESGWRKRQLLPHERERDAFTSLIKFLDREPMAVQPATGEEYEE